MKKLALVCISILSASLAHALTYTTISSTTVKNLISTNVLQRGTTLYVSSGTILSLNAATANIGTFTSTGTSGITIASITATNFFQAPNTSIIGPAQITGATCTATTGGSLATGTTLYWKVYAIPAVGNGSVGSQTGHQEMMMVPNGTVRKATLSWNTALGAATYALSRASALQGPDGVLISTLTCSVSPCVYVDTGAALTAGNPWPSTSWGSTTTYISGGIEMGAGDLPIVWKDYNGAGELRPYIGPTSAGEWVIRSGLGVTPNRLLLNNTSDQTFGELLQDPNDHQTFVINSVKTTGGDAPLRLIAGTSMYVTVDNHNIYYLNSTGLNVLNQGQGTSQMLLFDPTNNSAVRIMNPGNGAGREIAFMVTNGTAAYFTDSNAGFGGGFDFYEGLPSSAVIHGLAGAVWITTPTIVYASFVSSQTNVLSTMNVTGAAVFGSSVTISSITSSTGLTISTGVSSSYTLLGSSFEFKVAGGIKGTIDGSSAKAGDVGESQTASLSRTNQVNFSCSTTKTLLSITLTPGDWDIEAQVGFGVISGNPATTTLAFGVSTTTNTVPATTSLAVADANGQIAARCYGGALATSASDDITCMVHSLATFNSSRTYYLPAQVTLAAGSVGSYGSIIARRRH